MKYKILIVIFVAIGLLSMTLILGGVKTASADCIDCCEEYQGFKCDPGNVCKEDSSPNGWSCYNADCAHLDVCQGEGAGDTICLEVPSEVCSEINQMECEGQPACGGTYPQCDGVCADLEAECIVDGNDCVCYIEQSIQPN